jgi:hypothetical protein
MKNILERFILLLLIPVLLIAHNARTNFELKKEYPDCGLFMIPQTPLTLVRPARPTLSGPVSYRVKTHVRVHYTTSGSDATTLAYAESTAVFAETAWARVTNLGWYTPPPDQNVGGDNLFDIYLRSTANLGAYGVSVPDSAYTNPFPDGYSSWVEVTKDSVEQPFPRFHRLKALVAHEFHHSCQMRYSRFEQPFWWYYENTSTWIEDILFPGYGTLYWRNKGTDYIPNPLTHTYYPINSTASIYEYPGGLWPKFLAEYYGSDTPRLVWVLCGSHAGDHILYDTDSVLRINYTATLSNANGHYGVWRYFTGLRDDNDHFGGAELCSTAVVLATHSSYPASGNQGTSNPSGPGGCNFIQFTGLGDNVIKVFFDGQNGYEWSAYVLGRWGSYSMEYKIALEPTQDTGSIIVPGWEFSEVVLVPVMTQWSSSANSLTYSYTVTRTPAFDVPADGVLNQVERISFPMLNIEPNPFKTQTVIRYSLPANSYNSSLEIYDATGRFVTSPQPQVTSNCFVWDGRDANGQKVKNGVYFCCLTTDNQIVKKRITVLR